MVKFSHAADKSTHFLHSIFCVVTNDRCEVSLMERLVGLGKKRSGKGLMRNAEES